MNSMATAPNIFRTLSVLAAVHGGKATLLDRTGRPLLQSVPLSRVDGPIDASALEYWKWRLAFRRMSAQASGRRERATRDPWISKANSLTHSFRLRSLDRLVQPSEWCRFEKYSTTQWEEAIERLYYQAYNRLRRHRQSGWNLWAYTASKNHNKRNGGRYAKAQRRDIENDSHPAGATELPLCS
jgi:hypothetical protein